MHWVVSKDKRTGVKLSWTDIRNKLSSLYPNNNLQPITDEYGTSLEMQYDDGTFLRIKLNKIRYCGNKDGKWHENVPINSYIFENSTPEIVQVFKLQSV